MLHVLILQAAGCRYIRRGINFHSTSCFVHQLTVLIVLIFSGSPGLAQQNPKLKGGPGVQSETSVETRLDHAFKVATTAGFFATWTTAELKGSEWHFHGASKSASAPMYFVYDEPSDSVVYKNSNSSVDKVPEKFTAKKAEAGYTLVRGTNPPLWKKIEN